MLNRYIAWILLHYRVSVFISLTVVMVLVAGAGKLGLSNDLRVYFSQDNPQLKSLKRLEDTFSKQDNIFIYISPSQGSIFNKNILMLINDLTETGWQTPFSRRVDSLSNFQFSKADGDDLYIDQLITDPENLNASDIEKIKTIALAEPALVGRLVANSERATGINITLTLPDADPSTIEDVPTLAAKKAYDFVKSRVSELQAENPDVTILLGGVVSANLAMGEAIEADLSSILPFSYLILMLGIYLFLRSIAGTAQIMLIITLSVLATFGIFGWMGTTLTPTSGFVPTALMTIAVADGVHFLITYYHNLHEGSNKQDAIAHSLRTNFTPITITTITTAIGMLCLNFSEAPPYRDMGNMIAVGVLVAYLLTMFFLPALVAWLPPAKARLSLDEAGSMDKLANLVIANHRFLLFSISGLVVLGLFFVSKNELSEKWHQYYDESFEIRQAADAISNNLSGIHIFHYTMNSGKSSGIHNPDYWKELDSLTTWLREQPEVAHVDSFSDVLKRLNKNMHGDNADWYKLPDDKELVAQYLLMYEFSLPLGLGVDAYIDMDRSTTRMTVSVFKSDSVAMLALDGKVNKWLIDNAKTIQPTEGTGIDLMFSHITQRNSISMLFGTALALVLISFCLIFVLRSLNLGLISLLPNLAPAVLAYGLWGMFVGEIDLAASVVICISLGIVVDDTVHFLSKYQRARKEQGLSTEEAIRYTFNTVGLALVTTSLVLVAGFLITTASHFQPSANIGSLLAMTLGFALIVDLLLLPALLLVFDKE
ncbi:hypothetical protein A9Q81_06065 [Gammaproteobacteria bacterium 42_54_T18]|nr:hypothetical protein A9Q81_06065 [Gammaproteobacteria bacterium 42_54_T18]